MIPARCLPAVRRPAQGVTPIHPSLSLYPSESYPGTVSNRRGVVYWAELEVPQAPGAGNRRGLVYWAELELPSGGTPAPRRGVVYWAELEVPAA